MSLVNRMLLDLESRQSAAAADPVFAGLSSVEYQALEERRSPGGGRSAMLVVSLVVMTALFYAALIPDSQGMREGSIAEPVRPSAVPPAAPRIPAQSTPASPVETRDIETPSMTPLVPSLSLKVADTLSFLARTAALTTPPEPAQPQPAATGGTEISAVDVSMRGGSADIVISLSNPARFAAYSLVAPDRVVVEIAGGRVGDHIQRNVDIGPVQRLRARNARGQALLMFDLDRQAQVETAELDEAAPTPALRVALSFPDGSAAQSGAEAENPEPPEPEEVTPGIPGAFQIQPARAVNDADRLFDEGARLCHDGEITRCLAKLTDVVAQDPGHVAGRRLLATELVKQGDAVQAAAILDTGLEKFPRVWQWAQLRAQLAIGSGETGRALAVLISAPPAVADAPDYHALLAAVLQRAGRHGEAVNTYHSVLGRHPERGVWWMGLGISLQALERTREAGFAFLRALEDKTLTPELRTFVRGRMASLPQGG
ncbi:MAG: tetratricopeptide repeat protein [Gammaproteobacteria bacterium]|nr:tetratricopeptide repeat protein [Gammaproteobacteria bacterium]